MSVGEKQREAILAAVREAPDGLDAGRLARIVHLHPNTVRWHLGRLADQGLVDSAPERPHGPGRPSIVYRLTPDGVAHDRDEYRLLATMLTAVVAGDENGQARAYETGVRWGRYLMETPPPMHRPTRGEATAKVVELLDEQGFAAEVTGDTICMRRCPFYALAETNPEVICTLHQGILDGALEEAGVPIQVERLDPFVEPTLCIAHLSAA